MKQLVPVSDESSNILHGFFGNPQPRLDESAPTRPFPPRLILAGLSLITLFVGFFVLWSFLAPIESAIVSPGVVNVAGHRKQVQHLEGGIVEDILVKDGDRVIKGQLLVKLKSVKPTATLRQLERERQELTAEVARLHAEYEGSDSIKLPPDLLEQMSDPQVASIIKGQQDIFQTKRNLNRERELFQDNQIIQAGEEIIGVERKLEAMERKREFLHEELDNMEKALKQKLIARTKVLQTRQSVAEVDGQISGYQAELARLSQDALEQLLQLSESRAAEANLLSNQLKTQQARLFELSQEILHERDVLNRTDIRSPINGIVVNLQTHTLEGVIQSGETLLEIVPTDDKLVVFAFLNPEDIEEVLPGMPADIQLTSINRRERVPIPGRVTDISADRLHDPRTGQPYYQARIDIDSSVELDIVQSLIAGMGAEIFIKTGARTPLDYLLAPITNSLQLGLREN